MAEFDLDELDLAGVGEAIQLELAALAAFQRTKGKGFGGKNKGKSKGKGKVVRSNLTLEQRRALLAEIKRKSKCMRCGGSGHCMGKRSFLQIPWCTEGTTIAQASCHCQRGIRLRFVGGRWVSEDCNKQVRPTAIVASGRSPACVYSRSRCYDRNIHIISGKGQGQFQS